MQKMPGAAAPPPFPQQHRQISRLFCAYHTVHAHTHTRVYSRTLLRASFQVLNKEQRTGAVAREAHYDTPQCVWEPSNPLFLSIALSCFRLCSSSSRAVCCSRCVRVCYSMACQDEGITPSHFHYNSMFMALEKGERWREAADLFRKMRAGGTKPNAMTYGPLIGVMDRCRKRDMVRAAAVTAVLRGAIFFSLLFFVFCWPFARDARGPSCSSHAALLHFLLTHSFFYYYSWWMY